MFVTKRVAPDVSVGFGVFSYFGLALDYGGDLPGRYNVQRIPTQTGLPTACLRGYALKVDARILSMGSGGML